jgi:riboflavin kinase / FMN adenylyltransferase
VIACLGKFDALHLGHRALAVEAARWGTPVLVGFDGMAEVLGWPRRPPLVATDDRPRILAQWPGGVRELSLPFATVRQLDPAGFFDLLATHAITGVVIGEDFRGGRDRLHDARAFAAAAEARGWVAHIVAAVRDEDQPVSSTRVREALHAGDVATAARLQGRPHRLIGTVVRGDGRGRSIGVPTANLGEPANVVPACGVYAAWADLDGARVPAALNIGHLPTIGEGRRLSVEAHLIGWTGDCYGRAIGLDLIQRLRDEQIFADLPTLVTQIRRDVASAQRALA